MANAHETLTGLFTDIAGAIRSKTGETGTIVADQFPDAISAIDTQENLDSELSTQDSLIAQISTALVGKAGVTLPVLSNPAGAANIEAGYQAIDGAGGLIEGTASIGVPQPTYKMVGYRTASTNLLSIDNSKTYIAIAVLTNRNSGAAEYGGWAFIKEGEMIATQSFGGGSNLTLSNGVLKCNVAVAFFYFEW